MLACALALLVTASAAPGGTLYAIRDSDNYLVTIDTVTLEFNVIGSTGVGSGDFGDLAYNSDTGTMYWVAGRGNNNLYTVDLSTGVATLVGSHGIHDLFTAGYDSSTGTLYGQSTSGDVYQISMVDGSATPIGRNGVYPGGYDYIPDTDQLILLEAGGGDIFEIDRTTGAATLLAAGDFVNDNDIAYDWDADVCWALDWSGDLYKYQLPDFSRTHVMGGLGPYGAVEYIPEPGTLGLLLIGVTLLARRR